MKFINNTLYLEFDEAASAGISEQTMRIAKHRKSSSWDFIDDPADRRKVLINYESIAPKYKTLITEKFGNPYEYAGANQLKKHITTDHAALSYLLKWRSNDGKALSEQHLNTYSEACNILNFLSKTDKKAAKAIGFPDKNTLFEAVFLYIRAQKIDLPLSYRRITEAIREYQANGAASIISKKLGNQNRAKVKDELSLALLKELISHNNKLGDYFIAAKYNKWAAENNRSLISKSTVGNYRREHEMEIINGREGMAAYRNKFDKIIHRSRPSAPLLLINSDDNVLDLYFINRKENKNRHNITDYYHRFVLYVVTDAYNDYPLGYAIGNSVTKELVKEAYRNAVHHVKELTGNYFAWHQIVTDRWGINPDMDSELAMFFKQQATFTPSKFSNARGKHIEQSFGKKWHNILRTYKNYAGHNITAQQKVNRDAIELHKDDFPTVDKAPALIAEFIEKVRRQVDLKTGISKQEQWIEGWNAMDENKKRILSDEERLLWFGKYKERSAKITNGGVVFELNKKKFIYDVPQLEYTRFVGRTGTVIIDPQDTTSILFTADEGTIRIICTAYEYVPSALADFKTGDRKLLNEKLQEKENINQQMLNKEQEREELLQLQNIQVESLLQAGVMTKQIAHNAQISYAKNLNAPMQELDNTEFNIFDEL